MDEWALPGFTELGSLGEGGFGRVVLARHDESAQVVAIKYLYARFAADPQRLAEFRHEAQILNHVSGPHIARLHQFVETPQGAAIIMEAVHGVSLKDILGRQEKLEPEAALAILKGSLLGLAGAHAAGAVHRDYKPANVLVTPEGQSKLVDFGIAVLAGQAGVAAVTAAAVGTVVVVSVSGDDPPSPPPQTATLAAMQVDLLTRTETLNGFDYKGQYVRISGSKDKAAEERVNKALMAPIDGWLENFWPDSYQPQKEPDGDIPHMKTEAEILRKDDKLVSVVYKRSIDSSQFGNHGGFSIRPIVIDLPARALSDPWSITGDTILQAAPTANGMIFYVYAMTLGYPRACDPTTVTVPYDRLGDLMSPAVKNLLGRSPGGTQAPRVKEENVGAFTITTPEKWTLLSEAPIERYLLTADTCPGGGIQPFHCAGVVISDNSRVDPATPAYEPDKPYHRSLTPRPCHSIGAANETQVSSVLQKKELRPIGTKKAAYEEWRLTCSGGGTVTQRVWFLPKTQLVIVDEWNTPGLDQILEGARWH